MSFIIDGPESRSPLRRWRYLDLEKPVPTPASAPPSAAVLPVGGSCPWADASAPPLIRSAIALYQSGQIQACITLLEAHPDAPGAGRLLGLAYGKLGEHDCAVPLLRAALEAVPEDTGLRASLASAQLLTGQTVELPDGPLTGPLAELAGAAAWLDGQRLLAAEQPRAAAASFQRSSEQFALANSGDPESAGAAYIGETVSWLAAGQIEAAQQCFARLVTRPLLSGAAGRFAHDLFAVGEALRELPPESHEEALAPLVALVREAHLHCEFYDQLHPVAIHWTLFALWE